MLKAILAALVLISSCHSIMNSDDIISIHILFKNPKAKSRKLGLELFKEDHRNVEIRSYVFPQESDLFLAKLKEKSIKKSFFIGPDHDDPLYDRNKEIIPNVIYKKGNPYFYEKSIIEKYTSEGYSLSRWKDMLAQKSIEKKVIAYINPFSGHSKRDCVLKKRVFERGGDYHSFILYKIFQSLVTGQQWELKDELALFSPDKGTISISRNLAYPCVFSEKFKELLKDINLSAHTNL